MWKGCEIMAIARNKKSAKQTTQEIARSERALSVIDMALTGMSWVKIGAELGIAPNTAKADVVKANKAALAKRDQLAEDMLALMGSELLENMNILSARIQAEQLELASNPTLTSDKKEKHVKLQLLAMDRMDKLVHRYATLMGLYPHDGGNKLVLQGVGSIQLTLGAPPAQDQPPTIPGTLVQTDDTE
jgi:hypothetical protein